MTTEMSEPRAKAASVVPAGRFYERWLPGLVVGEGAMIPKEPEPVREPA